MTLGKGRMFGRHLPKTYGTITGLVPVGGGWLYLMSVSGTRITIR